MNAHTATSPNHVEPVNPVLLQLEDLTLRFGGITAVQDVGFDVHRGELLSIIGPNGAGKSSLLNVVSGVYRPQQGQLRWEGAPLRHGSPAHMARLGVARTFQNLALFKGLPVLDNVIAGVRGPRGLRSLRAGQARRDLAEALIEFLHLQRWRHEPVGRLSYGLQKRVELARALAAQPRLLLLDEPMAGMTTQDKHDTARVIVEVNRRFGTTVVLIEHDMGVVMDVSDRIVVLDHGRKIADDRPAVVREHPDVIAAYLGKAH